MGFRAKVREAGEDEALGLQKAGSFNGDLHMLLMYELSKCYTSKHGILGKKIAHCYKGTEEILFFLDWALDENNQKSYLRIQKHGPIASMNLELSLHFLYC